MHILPYSTRSFISARSGRISGALSRQLQASKHYEGIRQYDSCDMGHSDNANIAAEHKEPAEVLSQLDNTSNSPVYGEYKCC